MQGRSMASHHNGQPTPTMQLSPRLSLMLILPPLMWAGNAVVGRLLVGSIDPLWLNVARWALALALLWPLGHRVWTSAAGRAQVRQRWPYLAALSLSGVGAYNALQYLALTTSTPLNVTLIAASTPVFAMALGALVYAERPRKAQWLGALLSLLGVAVVLSRGSPARLLQVQLVIGDLVMLCAVLCWAVYSWLLARPPAHMQGSAHPGWNWAELLSAQMLPGLAWALAIASLGEWLAPSAPTQWSAKLWLALAFIAVGPALIAYRAWGLAVTQAGPAVATIFANLTPLFAAILSAALLGEAPQAFHALAFGLIASGILASSWAMIRPQRVPPPGPP